MTTFELWMKNRTPHSPFIVSLFEAYLLAGPEDRKILNRSYPGYFIKDRVAADRLQ